MRARSSFAQALVASLAEVVIALNLGSNLNGKPLASNRLMGATPLFACNSDCQVSLILLPTGVTRPMPVIATRRGCIAIATPPVVILLSPIPAMQTQLIYRRY